MLYTIFLRWFCKKIHLNKENKDTVFDYLTILSIFFSLNGPTTKKPLIFCVSSLRSWIKFYFISSFLLCDSFFFLNAQNILIKYVNILCQAINSHWDMEILRSYRFLKGQLIYFVSWPKSFSGIIKNLTKLYICNLRV